LQDKEPYARATAALLLATNMTEESFKALSEFKGLSELPEQYRKEIDASLKYDPYQPTKIPTNSPASRYWNTFGPCRILAKRWRPLLRNSTNGSSNTRNSIRLRNAPTPKM